MRLALAGLLALGLLCEEASAARWWCPMCRTWHGSSPGRRYTWSQKSRSWKQHTLGVRNEVPPTPSEIEREKAKKQAFDATPQSVVNAALREAQLTPDDILYDLGCGDGRVCRTAVELSGCRAVGVEQDVDTAIKAMRNCSGQSVGIINADARHTPINDATVVWMYLYPSLIAELVPRIGANTRLIISYLHPIPGHPNRRLEIDGNPVFICEPQIQLARRWGMLE
jgi:hypothetical protein